MGAVTRKLDVFGYIDRTFFLFWCGEITPGFFSKFLDTIYICNIYFYTNASA
jgi:hypothetical protein